MLDYVLQFKGQAENIKNKVVEYNLYFTAFNGSGIDSYVVFNDVPQWRSVFKLIKKGAGIISLKILNGYVNSVLKKSSICSFQMWEGGN